METVEDSVKVISELQEDYKDVVKDYEIPPMVNCKSGITVGHCVSMQVNTKYEYTDSILNEWKQKFGADEYSVKVNRSKLYVLYKIHY